MYTEIYRCSKVCNNLFRIWKSDEFILKDIVYFHCILLDTFPWVFLDLLSYLFGKQYCALENVWCLKVCNNLFRIWKSDEFILKDIVFFHCILLDTFSLGFLSYLSGKPNCVLDLCLRKWAQKYTGVKKYATICFVFENQMNSFWKTLSFFIAYFYTPFPYLSGKQNCVLDLWLRRCAQKYSGANKYATIYFEL